MSLRQSIASINNPYKPPSKRLCIEEGTPVVSQGPMDLVPVIDRLERLQASIDNLLAICLREELEDSSAADEHRFNES